MLNFPPFRYGLALLGVAAAMGLRLLLEAWLGFELPPFVTFYPMVAMVAIVAGLGPGVLATALASLTAVYWILPPIDQFAIDLPTDQVRLTIFIFLGLLVSLISELHWHRKSKAAAHFREVEMRDHQEALLATEKRFQTMVNAMPQLGWIARPDGYITWYNERWYEYTGTTPEQMEGWGWQIVHDAVELPKVLERWKSSIATGIAFEMTFPLRGADGNFRMFLTRGFPLIDGNGSVVQWFGTNTDIEEQARKDMLVQESEARYRSLVEQAADGIFLANPQGHYIDVNSAGCQMLGYSREEVLNRAFVDVLAPTEIPKLESQLARLAGGELVVSEWLFLRKDGSTFLGEVRGSQLINGNFQGTLIDITERKKAEMLLAGSEKQHRTLFKNMLDGYVQCKLLHENGVPQDFIIINVNDQVEKLTGLNNVVGKTIREVIPGIRDSNPELFEICTRVARSGQSEKLETHLESLGLWLALAVYSNGEDQIVIVLQNVTARKINEQELFILNNLLSHEVDKQTSELSALTAHVQEVAEKERASLARELHDELGSNMAVAIMNVARLKETVTDPKLKQELSSLKDLLKSTTMSMRSVVSQLYPTGLDNQGFVAAIEWLVQSFKKHTGMEVEVLLPKENIVMEQTFELAAYRITQECLTNIAKHAEASRVQIEVKTIDNFLDLLIHDDGVGLPDKINSGGHGIFGMIERARYLGGSMGITNNGMGTTAHLSLPLMAIKPINVKRVLIVDDHAIVRDALRQLFSKKADDFTVEGEAADGKIALQMALNGEWDIILLDITLPKMNGIQVLEAIKAVKPKQPIIMLSSHSQQEYGEIAFAKGASDYIEKSDTKELIEAMRRAILLNQ